MKDSATRRDGGQALVVLTLALVGLLVAVGLAVDGGTVYRERRRMQNAADAAAKEGTRQLYDWQVKVAYPEDESGQRAVLSAVHTIAERNGVPDTNGVPGDTVNDNVVVYYVDDAGVRLSDTPITDPDTGTLTECLGKKCTPEGAGRCCGVEVEVHTEFGTALIGLAGISQAQAEASATGAFFATDGTSGLGDHALMACGSGCGPYQMHITGDGLLVEGTVHSNDGVKITLDHPVIGSLTYVDRNDVMTGTIDDPEFGHEAEVAYLPVTGMPDSPGYFGDFALANHASMEDVHYISGDFVHSTDGDDLHGLYYVTGDVHITGDAVDFIETTLVAEGQIYIQTDRPDFSPWPHENNPQGITLYSGYEPENGYDRCADGNADEAGITILGDVPSGQGVIFAPTSLVRTRGDPGEWTGMVIGWSVDVPGDDWTFVAQAPPLGSVAELERITLVR